jgi:hypothetical protein
MSHRLPHFRALQYLQVRDLPVRHRHRFPRSCNGYHLVCSTGRYSLVVMRTRCRAGSGFSPLSVAPLFRVFEGKVCSCLIFCSSRTFFFQPDGCMQQTIEGCGVGLCQRSSSCINQITRGDKPAGTTSKNGQVIWVTKRYAGLNRWVQS